MSGVEEPKSEYAIESDHDGAVSNRCTEPRAPVDIRATMDSAVTDPELDAVDRTGALVSPARESTCRRMMLGSPDDRPEAIRACGCGVVDALGARGDRAMMLATASARRSSGLWSSSSKNRGAGEGWATWVNS